MFPTDFMMLRRAAALLARAFEANCYEQAIEYANQALCEWRKRATDAGWGVGLSGTHAEWVIPALVKLTQEHPEECRAACVANAIGTKLTVLCEALTQYLDEIDAPHPGPAIPAEPIVRALGEPAPAAVTTQTIERKLAREQKRRGRG